MPATLSSPFRIENVANGGVAHFGDSVKIAPNNISKAYGGHSSFGTGMNHIHFHFSGDGGSVVSDDDMTDAPLFDEDDEVNEDDDGDDD